MGCEPAVAQVRLSPGARAWAAKAGGVPLEHRDHRPTNATVPARGSGIPSQRRRCVCFRNEPGGWHDNAGRFGVFE